MDKKKRELLKYAQLKHNPEDKKKQRDIAQEILDYATPRQRDFITDPSTHKAALCPRRAGKSIASLLAALHKAVTIPRAKILIIAKVRRQVKNVYWGDLKYLTNLFNIKCRLLVNELVCNIETNDSQIQFSGADSQDEIDKFRGAGYDLVIIDEAKSYSPALLDELLKEIIDPALMDKQGQMFMIGTPGAALAGTFYEVTDQKLTSPNGDRIVRPFWEKDDPYWSGNRRYLWSLHKWTSKDNIKMPHIWKGALEIKERYGWSDTEPAWRREYLGEWIPDDDAMVYKYLSSNYEGRMNWTPDPTQKDFGLPDDNWHYLMGLDLGYKDDTAIVLAAYGDYSNKLYYIHAEKHAELTIEEVAYKVHNVPERFGIEVDVIVADTGGLGAMIVSSLQKLYNLPVIAAKKTEKHAHIKLLNSDMQLGRVMVNDRCIETGYLNPLTEEWLTLQWADTDKLEKLEDPNLPNHCADAALYLQRYAFHHFYSDRVVQTTPGTDKWWEEFERRAEEEAMAEYEDDNEKKFYDNYRRP